ncbi:MAG: hypothetical protein HY012_04410 [Acidobacteria bacterium]|nr:hypothetical protein [Acidobacteriota bacterium]
MLLYVGPDQLIPLSGIFGTVFGLALMFWGKVMQGYRKLSSLLTSRSAAEEKSES